jgi:hypothetical protein
MSQASLIPSLQFSALAREVERQLADETSAVIAVAENEARAIRARARAATRRRVHEAIEELRREGADRFAGAKVAIETELRARAQRQAAQSVVDGFLLLREELDACWLDPPSRRRWTDAVARLCPLRLRPGAWCVEHPADWSGPEQQGFTATIGERDGVEISFKAVGEIKSGLRVVADQAVLDATPQGLLADSRTIAALILDEFGQE